MESGTQRAKLGRFFLCAGLLALSLTGCSNPENVTHLMYELRSRDASQRNQAALELGYIGSPHADVAVPALISLLGDPNTGVQSSAAFALRRIGTPQAKQALDRVRRFQDRN